MAQWAVTPTWGASFQADHRSPSQVSLSTARPGAGELFLQRTAGDPQSHSVCLCQLCSPSEKVTTASMATSRRGRVPIKSYLLEQSGATSGPVVDPCTTRPHGVYRMETTYLDSLRTQNCNTALLKLPLPLTTVLKTNFKILICDAMSTGHYTQLMNFEHYIKN